MCGIVGYIGRDEKKEILLNGLKELEYRVTIVQELRYSKIDIATFRSVGKLSNFRI